MPKKILFFYFLLVFGFIAFCMEYANRYIEKKTGLSLFAKRPFFSVLVTSYNYERYIRKTLDSILAQSYKNYEVIIVDDGSTDHSVSIIKEYVNKYKNFHLYQHQGGVNKGLPASFKLGVEKAKGNYIAVLESDDHWTADNLLEKMKLINEHPDAIIISNNVIPFGDDFNEISNATNYTMFLNRTFKEKNFIAAKDNLFNYIPTFSCVVIKRKVLQALDFDTPIPAFLDLYLYKQILAKYPLYYVSKPLTFWRRHSKSYNAIVNQTSYYAKDEEFLRKVKEVIARQKDF